MSWSDGVRRSPASCRSSWTRQQRNLHNVAQGWLTRMRLLDAYIGGCRMQSGCLQQAAVATLLVHIHRGGAEAAFVSVALQQLLPAWHTLAVAAAWETVLLCALPRVALLVPRAGLPLQRRHPLEPSPLAAALVVMPSSVLQRLGVLVASCPTHLVPLELPLHQAGGAVAARPQHRLALGCKRRIRRGTPELQKRLAIMRRLRICGKR
mmetsp:Transcript_6013/g.10018  ORF Transcript_6013/g.10018 Transcript_6013/m.10018 type:complete len:208 (-) Transcript_6013:528-1151(-)